MPLLSCRQRHRVDTNETQVLSLAISPNTVSRRAAVS